MFGPRVGVATVALLVVLQLTNQEFVQKKVDVTVYYESLCPDSVAFITRQFYPTWRLLNDYINVKFVPFGKSWRMGEGKFECQHGPRECAGNMLQSCALGLMQQGGNDQAEFVNCIMSSSNPILTGQMCSENSQVSWAVVKSCTDSNQGYELQVQAETETKAIAPEPSFVPTIIFNNVFKPRDQKDAQHNFKDVVCRYLPHPRPFACTA